MNNPNDLDMISSYDDPIYNEVIRRKGLTNYSDLANLNKDETGTGSGSKITIPEFENMPPDKLITVTDPTGRKVIVRFDGKGVHDAVGDNKSWYKFVDPISGREVTIETSRDKSSKQKSAVVWSEATNTNNTNENDSNNGNVNSRLGRKNNEYGSSSIANSRGNIRIRGLPMEKTILINNHRLKKVTLRMETSKVMKKIQI